MFHSVYTFLTHVAKKKKHLPFLSMAKGVQKGMLLILMEFLVSRLPTAKYTTTTTTTTV